MYQKAAGDGGGGGGARGLVVRWQVFELYLSNQGHFDV